MNTQIFFVIQEYEYEQFDVHELKCSRGLWGWLILLHEIDFLSVLCLVTAVKKVSPMVVKTWMATPRKLARFLQDLFAFSANLVRRYGTPTHAIKAKDLLLSNDQYIA
jgi:hypothetical protein